MLKGILGNWPRRLGWTLIVLIALAFVFGSNTWSTIGSDLHSVITGLQNMFQKAQGH